MDLVPDGDRTRCSIAAILQCNSVDCRPFMHLLSSNRLFLFFLNHFVGFLSFLLLLSGHRKDILVVEITGK
jgi:hypothetical protein